MKLRSPAGLVVVVWADYCQGDGNRSTPLTPVPVGVIVIIPRYDPAFIPTGSADTVRLFVPVVPEPGLTCSQG
jgi:hypothetical protein